MKNIILENISKVKPSKENLEMVDVTDQEISNDVSSLNTSVNDFVKTNEAIIDVQDQLKLNEEVLDKASNGEEVHLDELNGNTENLSVVAESLYRRNMKTASRLSGVLSQESLENLYGLFDKKLFNYTKENFSRTPRMLYNNSKEDLLDIISKLKDSLKEMYKEIKSKYLEILVKLKTKSIKESFGGPDFHVVINTMISNGSVLKNRNFINEGVISKSAYDVESVLEFFKDFSVFDKRVISRIKEEVANKGVEPEVAVNKILYGDYNKFKLLSDRSKAYYKDKLYMNPENSAKDFILISIENSNLGKAFYITPDFKEAGFVSVKLSPIFSYSKEIDNGVGDNLLKRMKEITEKGSEFKKVITEYVDACIDTIKTKQEPKDENVEEQKIDLCYNKQLKNIIDSIVEINNMSKEFKKINEDIIKNFE